MGQRQTTMALILFSGTLLAGCGSAPHQTAKSTQPLAEPSSSIVNPSGKATTSPSVSSVTTQQSSSTNSNSSSQSPTVGFSSVIQEAMKSIVGHTSVPLYAPPTIEDFSPSRYYSASTHISSAPNPAPSYTIHFYKTNTPVPANNPLLFTLNPLSNIGGYRVSLWPSITSASQHLFYLSGCPPRQW